MWLHHFSNTEMNASFLSTGACYIMHSSCAFGHLFLLSVPFSCRLYVANAFSYVGTEMCCHFFILKHNALAVLKVFSTLVFMYAD